MTADRDHDRDEPQAVPEARAVPELHDEVGDDEDAWLRYWDPGRWLARHVAEAEAEDCLWLETLAAFDDEGGWKEFGTFSCAEHLMANAKMARSTAYERVRISHQLQTRTVLADAYRTGTMSYSALRVCCRAEGPDPAVDEAFVAVAQAGTVADVEKAVRTWKLHHAQETPPPEPATTPQLRIRPWSDGMSRVEILLPDTDAAEVAAALTAFLDRSDPAGRHADATPAEATDDAAVATDDPAEAAHEPAWPSASADDRGNGDGSPGAVADDAVTASASADAPGAGAEEGLEPSASADAQPGTGAGNGKDLEGRTWPTRRADAFMELIRAAVDGGGGGDHHKGSADRYLVHVVARDGQLTFPDGTPIHPDTAATLTCDAAIVNHTVGPTGEPLSIGRRSYTWTAAQRRAVLVRDGGTCRFHGCERHRTDIHHLIPWEDDGPTDLDNAVSLCPRHHTLLHHGFRATGNPNGTLHFHSPDGRHLGATAPAQAHLLDHQVAA